MKRGRQRFAVLNKFQMASYIGNGEGTHPPRLNLVEGAEIRCISCPTLIIDLGFDQFSCDTGSPSIGERNTVSQRIGPIMSRKIPGRIPEMIGALKITRSKILNGGSPASMRGTQRNTETRILVI